MLKPKISIIIPCYNDSKYISKSIESAFNQTYVNKEIIVVDDGSDLLTKQELSKLSSKINLLITQKNKGVSAARNMGILKAKGDFILTLDSDDYFEPEFCKKAINEFIIDSEIAIVTCHTNWFKSIQDSEVYIPGGGKLDDILLGNVAMGSTMFRKISWEKVGGYDIKMINGFEDWEFYIRVLEDGGKIKVIPEVLFNYRKRSVSRSTNAANYKYELQEYIYLKHSNLYQHNIKQFIQHLFNNLKVLERKDNSYKLEKRIGRSVLKPLRKMKLLYRRLFHQL